MTTELSDDISVEEFLAHYGVLGMHWGVRRNSETGVRPIAKALNDSKFGKASIANADRYNARQAAKKSKSTKGLSPGQKKALKIGGAVLLIGGAAAAAVILAKSGKLPTSSISSKSGKFMGMYDRANLGTPEKLTVTNKYGTSKYGSEAVKAFDKSVWNKQVKDFEKIIADSHADQTKYMRKSIYDLGGQYIPRNNPFTPEAGKFIR